ncbi:MAG: hypothetical protein IJ619_06265 [Eubacterium sp.]|nr:hypothetical protein [Eubacterium sp.]
MKKRGDCFGEPKICSMFKGVAAVSRDEINRWPVVMRSNRHSDYLEKKKDQERFNKNNRRDSNIYSAANRQERTNELKKRVQKEKRITIFSIRKKYIDDIIVWIIIDDCDEGFSGEYTLEYKGQMRSGYVKSYVDQSEALLSIIKTVIGRITDRRKKIVFIPTVPFEILRNKAGLYEAFTRMVKGMDYSVEAHPEIKSQLRELL